MRIASKTRQRQDIFTGFLGGLDYLRGIENKTYWGQFSESDLRLEVRDWTQRFPRSTAVGFGESSVWMLPTWSIQTSERSIVCLGKDLVSYLRVLHTYHILSSIVGKEKLIKKVGCVSNIFKLTQSHGIPRPWFPLPGRTPWDWPGQKWRAKEEVAPWPWESGGRRKPMLMLLSIHQLIVVFHGEWLNIPKYLNIIIYQREREREYPLESPRLGVWDDFPDSGLPAFLFFATETWMEDPAFVREKCSPKHLHGLRQKIPPLQPQLITQIQPWAVGHSIFFLSKSNLRLFALHF